MKGKRVFSRVLGARATTATLVGGLCLVIAGGVAFARVHTSAPKTISACANKQLQLEYPGSQGRKGCQGSCWSRRRRRSRRTDRPQQRIRSDPSRTGEL
jgi:hypothetical protein